MNHKRLYRVTALAVLLIAGLFIAFLLWQQRLRQNILIGEEQAIQIAQQACPSIGFQPVEQPTQVIVERSTYGRALNYVATPPNAERPVWVVKLTGRWRMVGGPPIENSNTSESGSFWGDCTVVIDAQTGETLSKPIE